MADKVRIGDILLRKKEISQEQLDRALKYQSRSGGRLASNLLELGMVTEEDVLLALGEQHGLPAVDLSESIIPLRFMDAVPENVAFENCILPLAVEQEKVILAMSSPDDQATKDEVAQVFEKKVEVYVTLASQLKKAVNDAYSKRRAHASAKYFYGEQASFPEGLESHEGFLCTIVPDLPEPGIPLEVKEELFPEGEITSGAPAQVEAESEQESGPLVLVVDDEPAIVHMITVSLTKAGIRVISALDGHEALQSIRKHHPDLIVLDAMLPKVHGFEICKKVKSSKKYSHIPVVMVTAVYRGWQYAEDAKSDFGADQYLEKPLDRKNFVSHVVKLLPKVEVHRGKLEEEGSREEGLCAELLEKGAKFFKEKRFEDAEKVLRKASEIDTFNPLVHLALANVLIGWKKIFQAMTEFEKAVDLDPTLLTPLKNLAILYQKNGFKSKAIEMWERALRQSPDEKSRREVREQLVALL